ncbi:MAG: cytochrome c [Chloroflexi bacterium]|nr:MAG: cytochrome c [Chloroflexota bacterium]
MQRRWIVLVLIVVASLWLVTHPPRFVLNWLKPVDLTNPVQTGEQLVSDYNCRRCHTIGGTGAIKAPDLENVTNRLTVEEIRAVLINPSAERANSPMPNFFLSDSEIVAIIAYLAQLDGNEDLPLEVP